MWVNTKVVGKVLSEIVKSPDSLVMVPVLLFDDFILTSVSGSPVLRSVTEPDTLNLEFCPKINNGHNSINNICIAAFTFVIKLKKLYLEIISFCTVEVSFPLSSVTETL